MTTFITLTAMSTVEQGMATCAVSVSVPAGVFMSLPNDLTPFQPRSPIALSQPVLPLSGDSGVG